MKNIYNERLLQFASHLSKIKNPLEEGLFETVTLVALEEHRSIFYKIKYHYWVFEELPVCFNEWGFVGEHGEPLWEYSDPEEGIVASAVDFFDMSLQEFAYAFDINGFQDMNHFDGEKLTETSDGCAIARNILEITKRRTE